MPLGAVGEPEGEWPGWPEPDRRALGIGETQSQELVTESAPIDPPPCRMPPLRSRCEAVAAHHLADGGGSRRTAYGGLEQGGELT